MAVVTLARFASLPEALVAKSMLEAEGITVIMPEQGLVAGYLRQRGDGRVAAPGDRR